MFGLLNNRKLEDAAVVEESYKPTPLAQAIIDATEDYDRWDWFDNNKGYGEPPGTFFYRAANVVYMDNKTGIDFNRIGVDLAHTPAELALPDEDQNAVAKALKDMQFRYEADQIEAKQRQCREQLEAAYMVDSSIQG